MCAIVVRVIGRADCDSERDSVEEFLLELSARTPAPGGGAAGAYSVAVGASLCQMVLRYAPGPPDEEALDLMANLTARAARLAKEDEASYEAVLSAFRSSKGKDPREASEVKKKAFIDASRIPSLSVGVALEVCEIVMSQVSRVNPHLVGDLIAAGLIAVAGGLVGAELVLANLGDIESELVDRVQCDLEQLLGVQSELLRVLGDKRSKAPLWNI